MSAARDDYAAIQARRYERNVTWAREYFSGSIGRTTLMYAPLLLGMGTAVWFGSGWPLAVGLVIVFWLVLLCLRVWARKHYRLGRGPADRR